MTALLPLLFLLQRPRDEGTPWDLLVLLVLFFVLPALARLAHWLRERLAAAAATRSAQPKAAPSAPAEERGAQAELEAEGTARWEELLATEVPAPPAAVPPPAASAAPPPAPPSPPSSSPPAAEPLRPDLAGLSTGPLARLDGALGPAGSVPAGVGLGRAMPGIEGLARPARDARARETGPAPRRSEWRRAVVLAELLSPPLALRPPVSPGRPPVD
ncbi:MAG: hypothetical protein AB1726_03340 [Planctomycetota bacterium]